MTKQNQELSLKLQRVAKLENKWLQELVDSDVIFHTITGQSNVTGKLRGVGEHFLFVEDVKILENYSLTDYLSKKGPVDEYVLNKQDFGVYNKSDIAEMYNFNFRFLPKNL